MSPNTNRKDVNENSDEDDVVKMPEPPDGGWGWVVVFSSFMIHVIADGVTYTFGIFYMEFLKYYKESKGTTAWVASIMVGTTFCVGPIASGLTNKYGCRAVTIAGSLLATFGLIMSIVSPSVVYLFFTIGLCTGAGFGLMYLPAIVCVTCYFEKKRAFATGIAVCGSGIGTFLLAPITEWLVDELGWKGAMLVIAGLVLNCCVFGALFRPLENEPKNRCKTTATVDSMVTDTLCNGMANGGYRKGSLPNGCIGTNGEVCFRPSRTVSLPVHSKSDLGINQPLLKHNTIGHFISDEVQVTTAMTTSLTLSSVTSSPQHSRRLQPGPMYRKDVFYSGSLLNLPEYRSNPNVYTSTVVAQPEEEEENNEVKSGLAYYCRCSREITDAFLQMMDFSLMRDVIFLMFGFSNFFTNIGFNVPFVYTKDRAVGMGIANEDRASYLLSVIGIANTVGRVILGYLSDRSWVNRLWLYNASLTVCGLATAFSSLCHDYVLMAVYAAVFGATAGAYVSLTSVILVDLLGLDRLTNAFGLLLVFEGVACLIGPPITGWLYDFTGSYDPGFSVSGSMIAISGLMLFLIPCIQRLRQRKMEEAMLPRVEITAAIVPAVEVTDTAITDV